MKNYKIYVNGQAYDVSVEEVGGAAASVSASARATAPAASIPAAPAPSPVAAPVSGPAGAACVKAPMPGTILNVKVAVGSIVKRGDVLLILEAMKMENEICAASDGKVTAVRVQAGKSVNTGDPLIDIV